VSPLAVYSTEPTTLNRTSGAGIGGAIGFGLAMRYGVSKAPTPRAAKAAGSSAQIAQ